MTAEAKARQDATATKTLHLAVPVKVWRRMRKQAEEARRTLHAHGVMLLELASAELEQRNGKPGEVR